jgi:hypothetical protein
MYAGAVGKMCAEVDRAYLAGLIDGDGCIMATIEKHREKRFGFRVRVEVKITQKDDSLLVPLQASLGMGRVTKNRTTCDLIVRDKAHVRQILELIQPYTRAKANQVALALQILAMTTATKVSLIRTAQLADILSSFNVRSKERRKNFATMIEARISSND